MTIVSSVPVPGKSDKRISYDEFYEKAFSEDGLDTTDLLMINVNDMTEDVYEECVEAGDDVIGFFTLTGVVPPFADKDKVENWTQYAKAPESEQENPEVSNDGDGGLKLPELEGLDFGDAQREVENLLNSGTEPENATSRVYVFGSSKGGTGKTFTSIMSTYRYAKTHPHQRIALVDFDIIDGQVGISIHKVNPTIRKYFVEYQRGYRDFRTMHAFAVHANPPFPQNVDFYLAPSNNARINDDDFWLNVIKNCIENYDVVVFDTGIDYINLHPISYVYKAADKVLLITTTSIKSVNSVTKQIGRLKGKISSKDDSGQDVFSPKDDIGKRLNVIITQMVPDQPMNGTIYNTLSKEAKVIATFGMITDSVQRAEFYGEWNVFDKNAGINKAFDNIMS